MSPPRTSTPPETYTVKSGDSLSKIAQQHYGDGKKWRAIFEANRDLISNPDLIHPGQVLKIPSIGDDTP
jgi:nucleoid-associated protein YgaU